MYFKLSDDDCIYLSIYVSMHNVYIVYLNINNLTGISTYF